MAESEKRRTRRPADKRPPPKPPPPKPQPPRRAPMSESKSSSDSVFEIDRIRRLVELMKEHDLSEIDLRESRQRIRICRGPKEAPRPAHGPPPPPPPPSPQSPAAQAPPAEAANIALIKSPMV